MHRLVLSRWRNVCQNRGECPGRGCFYRAIDLPADRPATDEERARISRAFYHVETFFNLFSAIPEYWPDPEGDGQRRLCELQETFMRLFSPVECEQLTCIVEFLWRKASTGTPYESLSLMMCLLTGDY